MELLQIMSFAFVAMLLVVSPGPNGLLITKTVPVSGKSAGFANVGGFIVAFYLHGALSILGISFLLVQSAEAFFIFKMVGAAYLFWIGIKACWEAWKFKTPLKGTNTARKKVSLAGAFFEGFLTNALNPKVSMFYLAAFPQFIPVGGEATSAFILVSVHSLLNLLWFSSMVVFLSRLKGMSRNRSFSRWLKAVTGPVFIGFGIKLAFFRPLNSS